MGDDLASNFSSNDKQFQLVLPDSSEEGRIVGRDDFVAEARRLRLTTDLGVDTIHKRLKSKFGEAFTYAKRMVGYWIADLPKGPAKEYLPYTMDEFPSADIPYLIKLDYLKKSLFDSARLTISEAEVAVKLRGFFSGPESHLDLFAQLGLVDAYARAVQAGGSLTELESLLAFQPWTRDGRKSYTKGLEDGWIQLPFIPLLTQVVESVDDQINALDVFVGAYAQLGIPFMMFYIKPRGYFWVERLYPLASATSFVLGTDDYDQLLDKSSELCNWREMVSRTMTGDMNLQMIFGHENQEVNVGNR